MRTIFTLTFLLSFGLVNAQFSYEKCKLVFKNGKKQTGYVYNEFNRPKVDYISFKKNSEKSTKEEEINNQALSKVILYDNENNEVDFERILTSTGWNKTKIAKDSAWLQVLVRGTCTLYHHTSIMSAGNPMKGGGSATFHDYYTYRKGEPAARHISVTSTLNNNQAFRHLAPTYFADYPELAKKIKDKEYTWKDIIEVVKEYNRWSASNKK